MIILHVLVFGPFVYHYMIDNYCCRPRISTVVSRLGRLENYKYHIFTAVDIPGR